MIPIIQTTPIFLNEEESKKFLLFMKHYDVINTLIENDCLTLKNGEVIIYYDGTGKVRRIDKKLIQNL